MASSLSLGAIVYSMICVVKDNQLKLTRTVSYSIKFARDYLGDVVSYPSSRDKGISEVVFRPIIVAAVSFPLSLIRSM